MIDVENDWQKNVKIENEVLFAKTNEIQDDQTSTALSSDLECDLAHHFDLLESGTLVLLQSERKVSEIFKDTPAEDDEEDFHGFHPNEVPLRKVIQIPEIDIHDDFGNTTECIEIKSEPSDNESNDFEFVDVLQLVKEPGDKNNLNSNEHKDDLKRKIEQLKEENKRLRESEKINADIQETMTNILKISSELFGTIKTRNQGDLMNFDEISGLARESEMIKFYHGPLRAKRKRLLLSNSQKLKSLLLNRLCELKEMEREKFSCDICGKTFQSNDLNLAHMISTHTKTCRVSVQDFRKVKRSIATQTGVDALNEKSHSKVDLIYKMHTNFVRMVNP